MNKLTTLLLSFIVWGQLSAQIDAGLFRYPDVSKTQIVFSYANDLWIMPKEGGMAVKLSSPPGVETFPKFSPDGKQVFITSLQSGELTIYDTHSRKEIKRLQLGHGAAGILMDQEGARAFVACSADNYIAIVDLKTLEVTSHLDVGGVPDGMAWAVRP